MLNIIVENACIINGIKTPVIAEIIAHVNAVLGVGGKFIGFNGNILCGIAVALECHCTESIINGINQSITEIIKIEGKG